MAQPTVAELQLRLRVQGVHVAASLQQALARVGGAEIRRQLNAQAKAVLGIEEAMKKASKAGGGFSSFLKTASRATIVARGLFDGFSAVGGAIESALEPLKQFQLNMAKVQSKGGLTDAETAAASAVVKGQVRKTRFGAIEASEASVGLAAAGQGKNLANTLPTVLNFAQANDISPEKSTEILLGVMGQFRKDIGDLEMIGDMITKTDQLSVLSVTEIFDTLRYVGPLAADAKLPLQDVLALVSSIGDQGIKASKAGTGLRNFMFSLAKDPRRAKQANKYMHQLGMTREDWQKGLDDPMQFAAQLDAKMTEKGWSPQKRTAANQTWFGSYGSTTSSALVSAGRALSANGDGTVVNKLTQDRDKIESGAAEHTMQRQAETIGKTFAARLDIVNNKFELLKVNLGEKFLPVIDLLVDAMGGFGDDMLNSQELNDAIVRISASMRDLMPLALKSMETGLALVAPGMQIFADMLDRIATVLDSMKLIDYKGAAQTRGRDKAEIEAVFAEAEKARKEGRLPRNSEDVMAEGRANFDMQQREEAETARSRTPSAAAPVDGTLNVNLTVDKNGNIKALVDKAIRGTGPNVSVRTGAPAP